MRFSLLPLIPLPEQNLNLQIFNLYRYPLTMAECTTFGSWTGSGELCARYQGAYVEAEDGRLLHILNHGIGVPTAQLVRGRLLAMTGIAEEPTPALYVSLWGLPTANLLAHFALPFKVLHGGRQVLLFSNDAKQLYCFAGKSKLYIWDMLPEWTNLAR